MDVRPIVERMLGCSSEPALEEGELVQAHAVAAGLLAPGEEFRAGIDQSWGANASRGVVLTDRRIFRYRGAVAREVVDLRTVLAVRVRRMWFAPAGPFGRGEALGEGPIVILRLRFTRRGGSTARLRLHEHAGVLHPFVSALALRFGDSLEVARTLPGL